MKNLFTILEITKKENEKEITVLLTNKTHPFFKAHFPNNEILAGFLQIDIVADILKHNIKKINKAKFLSIIKPDDIVKYCISSKDNTSYKIIIKNKENKKISEFSYEI
ncbi:hypothetical protein CJ671_09305 [Aliarcobacter cryaerophilus]|uniref:ApeI dehydratase-like domain-containing protein n=1 Tax=Aliarcobacter cryaerophilus TaxID=28198 RepID=A0A2S9SNT1_9BACT|nr:hypothetical protein [Aliarcobacter cryaerophilus]PRM88230.1 hypothetical protein CJ671_09305 [Aliarcobacter cryaerophilus]